MRILFFLLVSAVVHFAAASWLLAVSPRARAHKKRVYQIAAGLSTMLAALRLLGWPLHGNTSLHRVLAIAMVELAIVAFSLPWVALLMIVTRTTSRAVETIKPSPSDEQKAVRISRREAIERVGGLSIAATTTLALGWGSVRGRHAFELEEVVVKIPGWPKALEGYTIAQVSDIHVGVFIGDRELDEGFELVRRVRADLVVATGDLVDLNADLVGPLLTRLVDVGARDGAYAILGNHDHYAGADEVAELVRASKVTLLDNMNARIRREDGGGFALVGVDDLQGRSGWAQEHRGPDLGRALLGLPPDLPKILLAHQPQYFRESQGRVNLQLSGHTHGGQINPGFRPASLFMEYVAGRYERQGSTLWVNRGFGVVGPPARIGAPPEVTKIVLVAA